MKKSLIAVFGAMLATAACAETFVQFETKGPDSYSDGQGVINGEKYALVWTPSGETFAGFNADGTAAGNSKVVAAVPLAKGGKCPRVSFAVLNDYGAGTWGVYLLDTRIWPTNADGTIKEGVQPTEVGSKSVKGYGEVIADVNVTSLGGAISTSSVIKNNNLKITGLTFDDEKVYVKVKGAGKFSVVTGNDPKALDTQVGADRANEEDTELTIVADKDPNGGFFTIK